jgi:glycosyltransferase involved in cell wall biosynthesis
MQSNKINVLMISYGRGALYENKAGVLDRHIEYATHFNSLKIIYLTKKRLKKKISANLTIVPVYSVSYLISFLKALFINVRNYNVVTTQDPFLTGLLGLYYKKIFKIKLHVQNHSNFIDNKYWIKENEFNSLLNLIAKKIVLPQADRLRVVNKFEKDIYKKKLNISGNIIDIAPIAVNPIFLTKVSNKEIADFIMINKIDNKKFKIGWAGRFVRLKRLDYLFELVNSIKDDINVQLILAGDFKKSEFNLSALEEKYQIKPIYTGHLKPIDLRLFYNTIDLFVLTSDYEGYGMVVAEAITCSCPVLINNKIKGPREILKNRKEFTFNNKEDFLDKINFIDNNSTPLKDLQVNNDISTITNSIKKTHLNKW